MLSVGLSKLEKGMLMIFNGLKSEMLLNKTAP